MYAATDVGHKDVIPGYENQSSLSEGGLEWMREARQRLARVVSLDQVPFPFGRNVIKTPAAILAP